MQIGFNLLFKPKYNQMACGLFGAASDDVSKININKLKILGIFNDTRGGHSCGMSIDGDIIIGTHKNKLFKDFITEFDIAGPSTLPVVLGHTRFATGGQHNEDNAHPFGFGSNGDYFNFIGTHNGSLHNEEDLAEEYGIDTTVKTPGVHNSKIMNTRFKIDSEILLEIIYKKGFKVLEKYEGGAALAMYNTKKPNTIYLYHGSSPKVANSQHAIEERPLFYYQESENVVYYSSLRSSLEAINDTNGEINEFEHNIVYEIKRGNVASAKKHKIDRSKATQVNSSCSYNNTTKHTPIDYTNKEWDYQLKQWVDKPKKEWNSNTKTWDVIDKKLIQLPASTSTDLLQNHHNEYVKLMTDYHKDKVYYENLRFYMNKTLLNGVYVLTRDHNLVKVCEYVSVFNLLYEKLNKSDLLLFETPIKFYFIRGIQMQDEKDYIAIQDKSDNYSMEQLSHCSVYPIKDLTKENSLCYYRGNIATLSFSTLVGKDIIKIANGTCKDISRKPVNFTGELYYLKEDIKILENIKEQTSLIIEIKEDKNDDNVMVDLYKENILATVEYCIEDTDLSLSNNYVQNQIKTKFDKIKEFVTNILTI